MKTFFKNLRQDKAFRVLARQVFNATIVFITAQLTGLESGTELATLAVFALPLLNILTKYINTRFFGDLGVIKE